MYNGSYQQYGQASASTPPQMGMYGQVPLPQYYQQPQQLQPIQSQVGYPNFPSPYYQQQQQQQQQQHMSVPNPALQIATDPNAFAQMFKSHLAALTFNSKPIITDLTLISHEHVARMANVVAQCLEEHTLTCAPSFRLPALYTIDSICKNVGLPYTTLWSDRIARIFLDTYRIVDHSVKVRMEELLTTWRTAGMNGTTLFGDTAQWTIEQAIYGSVMPQAAPAPSPMAPFPTSIRSPMIHQNQGNRSPMPQYPQQQSHQIQQQPSPQQIQKTRTTDRLNRLLAIGSHDQHHNPHLYDDNRMQALTKLRSLVTDMPLSVEEMNQIEVQLNLLEAEVEARRGAPAAPQTTNVAPPVTISPRLNGNVALPQSLVGALANIGNTASTTPPLSHAALASTTTQTAPGNNPSASSALSLIASLRQAGLLPADKASATPPPQVPIIQQDVEYSNMIMGLNLKLTTADMQRELPLGSLEAIHFQELPLQCRQCANRYPAGKNGQASMDQHLDWHFRQNRRAKDSAIRGQSRSWFSRLEDWIRGGHDDEGPSKGDGSNMDKGGTSRSTTALTPAQEAELKAATKAFVPAPSDDPGVATKPCPICKELFKSEWSEEEEEWIWKNAVKVNGVYYHGSCHYSAKTLSSSVKQTSATGSREGTPLGDAPPTKVVTSANRLEQIKEESNVSNTAPALPVAGTKRKAEQSDDDGEGGDESTSKIAKQELVDEIPEEEKEIAKEEIDTALAVAA